jgi:hypothetical protein
MACALAEAEKAWSCPWIARGRSTSGRSRRALQHLELITWARDHRRWESGLGGRGLSASKSDLIEALAVATAALRESDLPTDRLTSRPRELKLLLEHREDLVA